MRRALLVGLRNRPHHCRKVCKTLPRAAARVAADNHAKSASTEPLPCCSHAKPMVPVTRCVAASHKRNMATVRLQRYPGPQSAISTTSRVSAVMCSFTHFCRATNV